MSTGNGTIQTGNSIGGVQTILWPLQVIHATTDKLIQFGRKFVQSDPLTQRKVDVIGKSAKPIGNIILDPSVSNVADVISEQIMQEYCSDMKIATVHFIKALLKSSAGDNAKSMLGVTSAAVDGALCLLKNFDNVRQIIDSHKVATKIGATMIESAIDVGFGLITGTLPLIMTNVSIDCAKSVCKAIMQGLGVTNGKQIVVNSILNYLTSGNIIKTGVKTIAKATKEVCKLITAPVPNGSSNNAP